MGKNGDPFHYYGERHGNSSLDAASIREAVTTPQGHARQLSEIGKDLNTDTRTLDVQVEGDITGPITKNTSTTSSDHGTLAANGHYAAGLMLKFAHYVETFDTTTAGLNQQVRTGVASSARYAGQAAAYEHKEFDPAAYEKKAKANMTAFYQPQYNQAVADLDDGADEVAQWFKDGPAKHAKELILAGFISFTDAGLYGVTLTPKELTKAQTAYYQQIFKDMTPDERAKYIVDHKEISGTVLDNLLKKDPETRAKVGTYVSDKIKGLDDKSDSGDVNVVNDLLTRFKDSKEVSSGILQQLGGHGLIEAYALSAGRGLKTQGADLKFMQLMRDVFRTGEPTLAAHDPQASRTLARDMVAEVRDPATGAPATHTFDRANSVYGLSYMLKDSELSTGFLDTMGDELDEFERNYMGPNHLTWRQMTNSGGPSLQAAFADGRNDAAFDPMSSYMSALGKNDTAALQFFQAGGENDHGAKGSDRQDYWIQHRYWSHDNFDGLMSALDAATTGQHNLATPGTAKQSADLMSHVVDLLARRHGLDFHGDGENFNAGDVTDAGTKHVAHMLTAYMSSVDSALEQKNPADIAPGVQVLTDPRFNGVNNMPIFSASELRNLVDVAVSTEPGFNDMRHGLSLYQNVQLQNSISQHGKVDDPTSQADARLEGFFVNAVGDTSIASAADKDARVQSWIDMGKDVVGEIPVPGGKIVEFLASHAIDAGAEKLSDTYANNEDKEVDSKNDYAVTALDARKEAIQQALVNGGTIKPSEVAAELTTGPNPAYTKQQVESWFPNGKFPTQAQYDAMNPTDQTNMRNALTTIVTQRHLSDTTNYEQTYKDMFSDYFEKGDGDGH